jgi:hypothetical protein
VDALLNALAPPGQTYAEYLAAFKRDPDVMLPNRMSPLR